MKYKIIIPKEEPKQPFYCSDRLELDDIEKCTTQCDFCGGKPKQILCGQANKFYRCVTCDAPCGNEGYYIEVTEKLKQETLEEAYLNKFIDEANKEFTLDRKLAKEVAIKFAKWQQQQENTANDILNYILTNDDGVGIALGYNSREMIEQHFKNIGYDR